MKELNIKKAELTQTHPHRKQKREEKKAWMQSDIHLHIRNNLCSIEE